MLRPSFIIPALVVLALISVKADAQYTANTVGIITNVITYQSGEFLIRLDQMPVVSGCAGTYFSVTAPNDEALNRFLSRVLTAKAMQEPIIIGYNGTSAGCTASGYIPVYRIG